uniref:Myb-like domain-containing protein n=1 Tax=Brassica oleracea var. oleracea TaxID=109376 RepID=A0A0D3CLY0_BRAOL
MELPFMSLSLSFVGARKPKSLLVSSSPNLDHSFSVDFDLHLRWRQDCYYKGDPISITPSSLSGFKADYVLFHRRTSKEEGKIEKDIEREEFKDEFKDDFSLDPVLNTVASTSLLRGSMRQHGFTQLYIRVRSSQAAQQSFIDLLNNQQQNTQPSIQLSASNISVFCTQWTEDAHLEAHTVEDRKEIRKWTPTEDVVLISAWLNTSKDPVVGNEQKAIAFWKRIASYVAASPKLAGLQKREASHCKQRWGKINEGISKFVGCYDAATKEKSSGQNETDVMKMAHEIFFNDYKVKFTLEHAWLELHHDQKWCGASTTKDKVQSRRRKLDDQSAQSSTYVPGEEDQSAKPVGVKATKAEAKSSVSKPILEEERREFQSMWEIRQKDFPLKEKLNKQKLLDSLIAKTEPLSELELALKNKLISVWKRVVLVCGGLMATYPSQIFRLRFRMNKSLFMRIVDQLSAEISYFQQRRDATGRFSHSLLQKATAAIHMMAYGCPTDAVDEYLRLGETTALLCLEHFVEGIINLFGYEYLRRPHQKIFNDYSILERYADFWG